jgi:hypothetical protein
MDNRLGYSWHGKLPLNHPKLLQRRCGLSPCLRCHLTSQCVHVSNFGVVFIWLTSSTHPTDLFIFFRLISLARIGFKNVRMWLGDVREHADPNLTCILVGNKVDLVESGSRLREVQTEEGEAWAKDNGLLFVEA